MKLRNISVKLDKMGAIVGEADEGTWDEAQKVTARVAWTVPKDDVLLKKVFVDARYYDTNHDNIIFQRKMKVEGIGVQTTFKG